MRAASRDARQRRRGTGPATLACALAAGLAAAGCSGGGLPGPGAERVEIGGDVFAVERRGRQVTVRNDSQGVRDAGRLYQGAEAAVVMATGCDVARMTQRIGANVYDARIDCRG